MTVPFGSLCTVCFRTDLAGAQSWSPRSGVNAVAACFHPSVQKLLRTSGDRPQSWTGWRQRGRRYEGIARSSRGRSARSTMSAAVTTACVQISRREANELVGAVSVHVFSDNHESLPRVDVSPTSNSFPGARGFPDGPLTRDEDGGYIRFSMGTIWISDALTEAG